MGAKSNLATNEISSYYGLAIDGKRTAYPETILITKHEDEYFFIRGTVEDIMSGPYNDSYIYFKCDQFEGLIKFLKDHGFITK